MFEGRKVEGSWKYGRRERVPKVFEGRKVEGSWKYGRRERVPKVFEGRKVEGSWKYGRRERVPKVRTPDMRATLQAGTNKTSIQFEQPSRTKILFTFFFMNGNTERAQCALSRVCVP